MSALHYVGYLALAIVVLGVLTVVSRMRLKSGGPQYDARYLADRAVPLRRWAQAALATYRGNVGDPGYWDPRVALSEMTESWSTPDREELVSLLDGYRRGEINVAFDKIRIIWLSRVAFGCGWFDEHTSWGYVHEAALAIRASYRSWDQVAKDVENGAIAWQREFRSYEMTSSDIAGRRELADQARHWVWPMAVFDAPL